MTIDTAIKELITMRGGLKYALTIPIYSDEDKEDREIDKIQLEAIIMAIDTMRKYQKIEQIVKEWREVGLEYDSCDAMMNIERVIADRSEEE